MYLFRYELMNTPDELWLHSADLRWFIGFYIIHNSTLMVGRSISLNIRLINGHNKSILGFSPFLIYMRPFKFFEWINSHSTFNLPDTFFYGKSICLYGMWIYCFRTVPLGWKMRKLNFQLSVTIIENCAIWREIGHKHLDLFNMW